MININLIDDWGGIDEKIKSSVLGLNKHGIVTTGSCEGDHAPCPWIMIKSSSKGIKQKFHKLLREFYETRKVPDALRIKTFPAVRGFYIYSGRKSIFLNWRKAVNEIAKEIAQGNDTGEVKIWKSSSRYQKEFIRFGRFLLARVPKRFIIKGVSKRLERRKNVPLREIAML